MAGKRKPLDWQIEKSGWFYLICFERGTSITKFFHL